MIYDILVNIFIETGTIFCSFLGSVQPTFKTITIIALILQLNVWCHGIYKIHADCLYYSTHLFTIFKIKTNKEENNL